MNHHCPKMREVLLAIAMKYERDDPRKNHVVTLIPGPRPVPAPALSLAYFWSARRFIVGHYHGEQIDCQAILDISTAFEWVPEAIRSPKCPQGLLCYSTTLRVWAAEEIERWAKQIKRSYLDVDDVVLDDTNGMLDRFFDYDHLIDNDATGQKSRANLDALDHAALLERMKVWGGGRKRVGTADLGKTMPRKPRSSAEAHMPISDIITILEQARARCGPGVIVCVYDGGEPVRSVGIKSEMNEVSIHAYTDDN